MNKETRETWQKTARRALWGLQAALEGEQDLLEEDVAWGIYLSKEINKSLTKIQKLSK